MNKAIRLMTVMILIAAIMSGSALALGIGTNNKAVEYESGILKSENVYIINDEKKDMYVDISVEGSLAEYAKAPKTIFVSASEEIKKFSLDFTLPKGLEKGDLKVVVSETAVRGGQIAAKVHAVVSIKIAFPTKEEAQEDKLSVTKVQLKEQDIETKAEPSGVEEEVVMKYNTGKAFVMLLTTVVAIVVLIDLTFYYRRKKAEHVHEHLREYIIEELESGKSKEDIKQNLVKNSWSSEKVEQVFEELKNELGKL